MYSFTDTGNVTDTDIARPSEALSIDGVYIEDKIPGYRTVTVSGRESYDMQYSEYRIGNTLHMQDYYQDSRVIEVEYQLQASTPEKLIQRYNVLNGLLNFKEAKIAFADEPDKCYIGSKTVSEMPPKGRLNVTSTFQIYCPDPHKYSVVTKQFPAGLNAKGILESTIYNEGTTAVPIDFTIHHRHDNGYVGIVTDSAVLQMGKIAEVDGVSYRQSETLINTNDFSGWTRDTSTHPENSAKKTNGRLQVNKWGGQNILQLIDPGGTIGCNGGMISLSVPPDSEGKTGAKNFYCYANLWFEMGAVRQVSTLSINFLDENDELLFCYMVEKNELNANRAHVMLRAGGSQKHKYFDRYFEPSAAMYGRNMFDWDRGHLDIVKQGSVIGGYYFGTRFNVDVPDLEDKVCKKVQLYIGQYDTNPMVTGSCFRSLLFTKNNVGKWADIPNRYPAGSTIEVDGHKGKIYTDGILRPNDEVRGSNYPLAQPGETKVQFYYSDFADPAPTITAKIREGWL